MSIVYKNKIPVLFFSKNSILSETMNSIFFDEIDFNFKVLTRLDDIGDQATDIDSSIIILDLTESFIDFTKIMEKKHTSLFSLSFIFLIDNKLHLTYIKEKDFTSYETFLKPFRVEELLKKIYMLAAKLKLFDQSVILLNGNFFEPKKNQIKSKEGNCVRLTEKETQIIKVLHRESGTTLTKDLILKKIWGYENIISTHTLETHIYRLRKKMENGLGETDLILKNKRGYYLNI